MMSKDRFEQDKVYKAYKVDQVNGVELDHVSVGPDEKIVFHQGSGVWEERFAGVPCG